MKVLYVTGYKPHEIGVFNQNMPEVKYIKEVLKRKLIPYVEDGLEWVIINGQLGTELWIAEVIDELKCEYEQLNLGIFLPFLQQEETWNELNQERYLSILSKADYVAPIQKKPYEGPHQLRLKNQFMVEKSDAMLVFYDSEKEGSPKYAIREAELKQTRAEYPILTIDFYDIEQFIEDVRYMEEESTI